VRRKVEVACLLWSPSAAKVTQPRQTPAQQRRSKWVQKFLFFERLPLQLFLLANIVNSNGENLKRSNNKSQTLTPKKYFNMVIEKKI